MTKEQKVLYFNLTEYFLDLGYSYEKAQKMAYAEVMIRRW